VAGLAPTFVLPAAQAGEQPDGPAAGGHR